MTLTVRLDTSAFAQRLEIASRETVNSLRRAVDKSARVARKIAIKQIAADIGVKPAFFRSATPLVRPSTQGNISATWSIDKKRVLISALSGTKLPVRGVSGSLSSTYRVTGGRSAALGLPDAFMITVNGQQIVAVRRGRKGRSNFKVIYGESPSTAMAQPDAAARKLWEKTAGEQLNALARAEMQAALDGKTIAVGSGGGDI